uniref:Uncharacterized protein n=1 Tax=Anguilla anguilla TaxID=7936 RepID=A0A0E9V753_ANGAN
MAPNWGKNSVWFSKNKGEKSIQTFGKPKSRSIDCNHINISK